MDLDVEPLEAAHLEIPDWLTPTAVHSHEDTFFEFRVGNLGLLVPVEIYCEVIEQIPVNPLPNTQPWFGGLLNLRGNLVPVIDLHRLFGEESPDAKKRRLFTIDKGEKSVAVWIDGLPQVRSAFPQPLPEIPPAPAILESHINAAYQQQGHIWFSIDYDSFFKALGQQIALG
jgi:twitching motility protein PilI